jgi:hypothetical protein
VDGKCVCDNPWPEPGGSGWTGPECRIAVFAPPADAAAKPGADLTQPCKEQGCDSLQPGAWHCHAVRTAFNESSWNFLAVLVNRTSSDERGDPDLFGVFTGGQRGLVQPNMTAKGVRFSCASVTTVRHAGMRTVSTTHASLRSQA